MSDFIDPPNDADPTISDAAQTLFYRLEVPALKLSQLFDKEPSAAVVGVTARNTANGCWIALTSRRVAQRLTKSLQAQRVAASWTLVDYRGERLFEAGTDAEAEAAYKRLLNA